MHKSSKGLPGCFHDGFRNPHESRNLEYQTSSTSRPPRACVICMGPRPPKNDTKEGRSNTHVQTPKVYLSLMTSGESSCWRPSVVRSLFVAFHGAWYTSETARLPSPPLKSDPTSCSKLAAFHLSSMPEPRFLNPDTIKH